MTETQKTMFKSIAQMFKSLFALAAIFVSTFYRLRKERRIKNRESARASKIQAWQNGR